MTSGSGMVTELSKMFSISSDHSQLTLQPAIAHSETVRRAEV